MTRGPGTGEAAGLIAGFAIWSFAFLLLYGAHGTLCAIGGTGGIGARAVLVGVWAVMLAAHAALIAWFFIRLRSATTASRFVRLASLTLSIAALGATFWTGLPVISLEIC